MKMTPKMAAISQMAKKRRAKMMAEGGMVESPDFDEDAGSALGEDAVRGLPELNELGKFQTNEIANPESQDIERMFAKKLFEQSEREEMGYAMGGLVQDGPSVEPDPKMANDGDDEPSNDEPRKPSALEGGKSDIMPSGAALSEEAKKALVEKRMRRKLMGMTY